VARSYAFTNGSNDAENAFNVMEDVSTQIARATVPDRIQTFARGREGLWRVMLGVPNGA